MRGTRWRSLIRELGGSLAREVRISLTPLVEPRCWVFVVGCYNSGTELLMHVLGEHPGISALPYEGQFLTDQWPSDYELGLPRMWTLREDLFRLTEEDEGPDATRLKREWLMRLDRSAEVFLEKSPPNTARTRWLQRCFENAHFIVMVRDGYAVAEGIRRKAEPGHLADGWPLDLCARQWARSYEVLLEDARHLERVHWLRYEDLAEEPGESLAGTLEFLGLPTDFDASSKSWSVHEREEPIRNMNPESWARLTAEEIDVIRGVAGEMLDRLGYAPPPVRPGS
ncbi:MAG: sulfotransferase [Gemmatimonadota bacterium]|nr:sulfotransferase [Gemmatimonadota bacterium]